MISSGNRQRDSCSVDAFKCGVADAICIPAPCEPHCNAQYMRKEHQKIVNYAADIELNTA